MITLENITYRYIYDLTAYFLGQITTPDKRAFELLIKRVRSNCPQLGEMMVTFDETIWLPDQPELREDLVQFQCRLKHRIAIFSFYMLLSQKENQEFISPLLEGMNG
jgi:hypothetical protein